MELKRQFLWPAADIKGEAVTEVQQELGFQDLVVQDEEDETAVAILKTALPGYARAASERWAEVGSAYEPWYDALRNARLGDSSRSSDFDELRAQVRDDLGDDMRGGW